jgi:RNA polymerase sigma-B factor
MQADEPTSDLFRVYRAHPDRRTRNELAERHLHLAEYHVRRFAARGAIADDVRQVASIALVLAVERFDPDLGVAFTTFASRTIEGECKRYLRDRTWSVRPPRRIQELHLAARRQQEVLTHAAGRPPTVVELANDLGETVERVLEALEVGQARRPISVDRPWEDSGRPLIDGLAESMDTIAATDARILVRQLIDQLDGRDRWILQERFFRRRSQPEIASQLGISQSYLSRVIHRILEQLRVQLEESPIRM